GWIGNRNDLERPWGCLQALGLRAWRFHRVIAEQTGWRPYYCALRESPTVDLTAGFDAYYASRCGDHPRTFHDQRKRARKLADQFGPLHLTWHDDIATQLPALIADKRAQYQRTGVVDVLGFGWTVALLHRLAAQQSPACAGVMSVLRAGERVVARHFGLRASNRLHAWFPAYDADVRRWSPGLQLWIELFREATNREIVRCDLGAGGEPFKAKLANGGCWIAEGVAETSVQRAWLRREWYRGTAWLKTRLEIPSVRRLVRPLLRSWKRRAFR
ncbi:MAG TPA: GNAT family N-acetyltransferase, partial [Pirellulaceae bacterium]